VVRRTIRLAAGLAPPDEASPNRNFTKNIERGRMQNEQREVNNAKRPAGHRISRFALSVSHCSFFERMIP
jgi:hypothetical protein